MKYNISSKQLLIFNYIKQGHDVRKMCVLTNTSRQNIYEIIRALKRKNFLQPGFEPISIKHNNRTMNMECCYFCDFDLLIEQHHLINKQDGGSDENKNILPLCPNHHRMLHFRNYYLTFSFGHYIMRHKYRDNIFIYPTKFHRRYKRKNVLIDINEKEI